MSEAKCGAFALHVTEQWRDCRNVGRGLRWKPLACCEVLFIPRRTGVIGSKEACRSEAVVHLLQVPGGCQNIVAGIERIEPESIALGVFGLIAGLATLIIAAGLISRTMRRESGDLEVLRALGGNSAMIARKARADGILSCSWKKPIVP